MKILLSGAVLLALAAGCERRSQSDRDEPRPAWVQSVHSAREAHRALPKQPDSGVSADAARELTWTYPKSEVGPMTVVVSIPARHSQAQRFPVLIALHGRGESAKGPERGARGWIDDYGLLRAEERLTKPPLTSEDLQDLYGPKRLADLNARLAAQRYQGLIVVCPYTPDILAGKRLFSLAEPLARFLVDRVLPRVRRETPAESSALATGIDGVSLGGRAALLVGLGRPTAFGAVAGLQPAFDRADAPELVRRARLAREQNPKLFLRLVSSNGDYFLSSTRTISRALRGAGIEHELSVVVGPHDYEFNRGPAAYEMLLFHDRALRAPRQHVF